ncbi:MAG: TraB/GumN family protein [Rhodobacterales bacterium]|nr:TraB/GumN family protein [Rhodobacterales bacterium]
MLRALNVILSLLAAPAFAQCEGPSLLDRLTPQDRAELDSVVASMPFSEGLIWEAERDGKTITVAGTMHIHDPRFAPIEDKLLPMLKGSDLLLLEMTPVEQREMQEVLGDDPSLMLLADGKTLPSMIDPVTWAALSEAAGDRNIPPVMAARLRPWFLMLSLSMPVCAMGYLVDGQQGLDMTLMDAAEKAGVPMQALEPWDTMFNVLEHGTMEEQLDFLRMGILDAETQQQLFVAMLDGYFAGKVAEVWELSRLSARFIPGISPTDADALFEATEDVLLTGRNDDWILVIETAAAAHDRIMVAAGAAHLTGTGGVLALLQDRGWTITRLY